MRNKLCVLALAIMSVVGLTIGGHQTAKAAIDNSRDCDKYAIIYCGVYSESEFRDKFNDDGKYNDHAKVFAAFGIDKSDVNDMTSGIVYKNGDVKVDGKTVATDARQAARSLGGTKIPGTSAAKVSTSVFGDEGQTALIKLDKNGKFVFAIIKSCGNPVVATPKPVPPKKNPTAKCTSLQATLTNNKNVTLTASASTSDGADIKSYTFTITRSSDSVYSYTVTTTAKSATATTTVSGAGAYVAKVVVATSEGNKSGANCETTFNVTPPPVVTKVYVCNPKTGQTIQVNEKDQANYPPVGSRECQANLKVCELATKKIVTIKESDFTPSLYSKDVSDCAPTPVTPVAELPQTGPLDNVLGYFGIGSLITAGGAYVRSRRSLF